MGTIAQSRPDRESVAPAEEIAGTIGQLTLRGVPTIRTTLPKHLNRCGAGHIYYSLKLSLAGFRSGERMQQGGGRREEGEGGRKDDGGHLGAHPQAPPFEQGISAYVCMCMFVKLDFVYGWMLCWMFALACPRQPMCKISPPGKLRALRPSLQLELSNQAC